MSRPVAPDGFDYRTARTDEILAHARRLVGRSPRQFLQQVSSVAEAVPTQNKGRFGHLVEEYFGIPQNSRQDADFPSAAIELKVVPLVRSGRSVRVKERTSLTMIDYHRLADENWDTAAVRKKLDSLLLVYYFWDHELPPTHWAVAFVGLWRMGMESEPRFHADWEAVAVKVRAGRAETISEGDGRYLGAATKGADGGHRVPQPRSAITVKPRAWALKPGVTGSYYMEHARSDRVVSIRQRLRLDARTDIEAALLMRLERFVQWSIGVIGAEIGVGLGSAKNAAASVIRSAIGLPRRSGVGIELERLGVTVKTVPTRSGAVGTYEHMSFPAFKIESLLHETWEDALLRSYLERLLIVPITRRRRTEAPVDQRLEQPFFWTPTDEQFEGIRAEWEFLRAGVASGRIRELPGAKVTKYIHIRTHGKDAADTDHDPTIGAVPKRCFWLNGPFVANLIREAWQSVGYSPLPA